jgi:hypothetical protein
MGLCAHMGCTLFPGSNPATSFGAKHPVLPPIQTAPEAVQLEVFFLERPAEDQLLANGIWKEVDQIGALPAETREILRDNGFRLGHVSSNPPPSVQKLLGMVAEFQADADENTKPLMGRRQFLSPGVETEIPTGVVHDQCDFVVREAGRTKRLEYDQVSCVLRMKARRLEDGWVRVDFQPEIHHGEKRMRTMAAEEGWMFRGGQEIDVRQAQRFSLTMTVGELAIITASPDEAGSLGDGFFCHEDRGLKKQRVLIIRIVDAGQTTASLSR